MVSLIASVLCYFRACNQSPLARPWVNFFIRALFHSLSSNFLDVGQENHKSNRNSYSIASSHLQVPLLFNFLSNIDQLWTSTATATFRPQRTSTPRKRN
uniref:Secreted protein n=1 Tax=Bursaphelenchus xylophilus TaxID=6326 RepID=A0A1I7S8Q9_BURXY